MKEYKSYECKKCRKTTIVITGEVSRNRYLVCSHCSSKEIKVVSEFDDMNECMRSRSYKRVKGALHQK